MKVIQAWAGDSFFDDDREYSRLLLLSSARHWKALFPEDKLVLYLSEPYVSKYFRQYDSCTGLPWTKILSIPKKVLLPLHDSSRFYIMTLGDREPFIYLDADFLTFDRTLSSLCSFREKIKNGFFVKGTILMGEEDPGHGQGEDMVLRHICSALDYPYREAFFDREDYSSTVLLGGKGIDLYTIGVETLKVHKCLDSYRKNNKGIMVDLFHEWASGVFPELVAERFNIPLAHEPVEDDACHLGAYLGGMPLCENLSFPEKKQVLVELLKQEQELGYRDLLSYEGFLGKIDNFKRSLKANQSSEC